MFACAWSAFGQSQTLYENNFEKAEVGKVPDDFLVLDGQFAVVQDGTNRVLELPGAPLDFFGVQFGPVEKEDVAVSARIFGIAKGRRLPVFSVGLGGVAGYRLQVSAAKNALEIYKDQDLKTGVPFKWKPGAWTLLRMQVRKIAESDWKIEGKAWPQGQTEPKEWMISLDVKEQPNAGRASVTGSPFSGTPIWFDDFAVEKVSK